MLRTYFLFLLGHYVIRAVASGLLTDKALQNITENKKEMSQAWQMRDHLIKSSMFGLASCLTVGIDLSQEDVEMLTKLDTPIVNIQSNHSTSLGMRSILNSTWCVR